MSNHSKNYAENAVSVYNKMRKKNNKYAKRSRDLKKIREEEMRAKLRLENLTS